LAAGTDDNYGLQGKNCRPILCARIGIKFIWMLPPGSILGFCYGRKTTENFNQTTNSFFRHGFRRILLVPEILFYWRHSADGFYLQHRLSEDIDLFSEEEVHLPSIRTFLAKVQKKLKIKKLDYRQFLGLHTFQLFFSDKNILKVDFNYYPFPRIEKGINTKFGCRQPARHSC